MPLPELRRTPDDRWLVERMRHAAEISRAELALTDAIQAALATTFGRMRTAFTSGERPSMPDQGLVADWWSAALDDFVAPVVGEAWWAQNATDFGSTIVDPIISRYNKLIQQVGANPAVSDEQERTAALSLLYLGGGPDVGNLTADGWGPDWGKAWKAWEKLAELDDSAAVARGHLRVAEALQAKLPGSDAGTAARLQKSIDTRTKAASRAQPSEAALKRARDSYHRLTDRMPVDGAPTPGHPKDPEMGLRSKAPQGKKAYYEASQRMARSLAVANRNDRTVERAKAGRDPARQVKVWLATADQRCRPDHRAADDQAVALDDSFFVCGEMLRYPGDPRGSDECVANCRCSITIEDVSDTIHLTASGGPVTEAPNVVAAPDAGDGEQAAPGASTVLPQGWRGVLAPLDTLSGDGREIAAPTGELRLRLAPIPFSWQRESGFEHENSVIVGRIDRAWVEGGNLMGEGPYDLGSPDGMEAARQLAGGFASRVSVDLADVTMEFRPDENASEPDLMDLFMEEQGVWVYTDWQLAGATQVAISAFDEAIIAPVYDYVSPLTAAGEPMPLEPRTGVALMAFVGPDDAARLAVPGFEAASDLHVTIAYLTTAAADYTPEERASIEAALTSDEVAFPIAATADAVEVFNGDNAPDDEHPPCTVLLVSGDGISQLRAQAESVFVSDLDTTFDYQPHITLGYGLPAETDVSDRLGPVSLDRLILAWGDEQTTITEAALVASVAPLQPPRSWFNSPKFGNTDADDPRLVRQEGGGYGAPMHIGADGQFWAHIATWGVCHTGIPGVCTMAPHSKTDYSGFHLGMAHTDQGPVPVGVLTFDTGHADLSLDARAAVRHYDNTGTAFAIVRAGEDQHGIWAAGSLLPDVDPKTLPRIRAAKLSGDWRAGELRAALASIVPGFPVHQAKVTSLTNPYQLALVAAGVVHPEISGRLHTMSLADNPELIRSLATAVEKELEARSRRRNLVASLTSKVKGTPSERVAQLAERIGV